MKDNKNLYDKLILLLFNQFKLRIKLKNNSLKETHLLKKNRKNIAKIKTLISLNNKYIRCKK